MNKITVGSAGIGFVATLALSGSALAQSASFADARGDIDHGADIHRVKVTNEDSVRVTVKHANLVRSYRSGSGLTVFLDTNRQKPGPEYMLVGGTFSGTDYALVKAAGWQVGRRVNSPGCTYRMDLDYRADTATVTMDRDCLSKPGAIRVAVRTTGAVGDDTVRDWLDGRRNFTPLVARG